MVHGFFSKVKSFVTKGVGDINKTIDSTTGEVKTITPTQTSASSSDLNFGDSTQQSSPTSTTSSSGSRSSGGRRSSSGGTSFSSSGGNQLDLTTEQAQQQDIVARQENVRSGVGRQSRDRTFSFRGDNQTIPGQKTIQELYEEDELRRAETSSEKFFTGINPAIKDLEAGKLAFGDFEKIVTSKGGAVGGMSTTEGERIQVFAPATEPRKLTEFTQSLSAKEFFPAAAAEAAIAFGQFGADVVGFGKGFISAGLGSPDKIIEKGITGFESGKSRTERILDMEGRETGIIGTVATAVPFAPGAVNLGIKGIRGTSAFAREGVAAFKAGTGTEFAVSTARDVGLALSPVKPARASTAIKGVDSFSFGTETLYLSSEGKILRADRIVTGSFVDTDVTFRTGQAIVPTQEGLKGFSVTETNFPKYAANIDEIFGGTRTQFSFGVQDISPIKGKPGTFEALQSESRLATIFEKRPGEFVIDIAKSPEPIISSRPLSRGASERITKDFDFVAGIGGKPIGGTDVFKVEDYFIGVRRTFREPSEDIIKILKPADIQKTPLSKTFGEQININAFKPRDLPTPPKPSDLKTIQTTISNGALNTGLSVGILGRGTIQSDFFSLSGFSSGLQAPFEQEKGTKAAGFGTLEFQQPRIDFSRSFEFNIQPSIQVPNIRDAFDIKERKRRKAISTFRQPTRQLDKQFSIERQIQPQIQRQNFRQFQNIEQVRPITTFRAFDFGFRPGRPAFFLPPIAPLGQDVSRGIRTGDRGFKFTPSFAAIQFPDIIKGFGEGSFEAESGLFEREFKKMRLPNI